MGYFDELADAAFKTDEKGNTIFYPLVIFGKGYILPNDKKDMFRLTIKRLLLMAVPLAFVFSMFMSLPRFILIILPLYIIGCVIWMKINTSGLSLSPDKLALFDTTVNSPRSYTRAILWSLEVVSFIFILASTFVLGRILHEWSKN